MNPHLGAAIRWLPAAAGVASFFITVFIGLVIYDTIWHPAGIKMDVGVARGWNNEIGLVVEYERAFTVTHTADGEVQRIVRCPPDGTDQWYFDGPVIKRTFEQGYYPPVRRPMQFPQFVPVGTKCKLEVWGAWRNRFAVTSQRWKLDEMEFVVEASPRTPDRVIARPAP